MNVLEGKHIFGTVKVGEKGQIVIPKEARKIFGINPGDTLMLIGDETSGLALITSSKLKHFFAGIIDEEKKRKAENDSDSDNQPD